MQKEKQPLKRVRGQGPTRPVREQQDPRKGRSKLRMGVNDGADRSSKDVVSPFFDCTRRNVRREWSKWRDLGASGQI